MKTIVTAGASTCALALVIIGLQYQADATESSLASAGNTSASWEAFNTSSRVLGDVTVPLASGLPLALVFAFIVTVFMLAYGVSGR